LLKIKEKEEQLEIQLAEAKTKKEQMIQEARQEAVKLLHDGELVIEKKMAQRIAGVKEALGKEKEQIIQEKAKDTEKIKLYAEQNFEKAIPIVLDIFERSVNAQAPKDE
jgi:vacuolar-type H+-ATPase subunit H